MPISERELAARNRQLHETGGYQNFNSLPEELKREVVMRALQNFRTGRPATQENFNRMREIMANDDGYAMQQMRTLGLARELEDPSAYRDEQLAYGRGEFAENGEPMGQANSAPEQTSQASTPTPPKRSGSSNSIPLPPDPSGAAAARDTSGGDEGEEGEFDESSGGMMDELLAGAGAGTAGYLLSRYLRGQSNRGPKQMPENVDGGERINEMTGADLKDTPVMRMPPGTTGADDGIEEAIWRYIQGETPNEELPMDRRAQLPRGGSTVEGPEEPARVEAPARRITDQRPQEPEARPAAETPEVIRQGGAVSDPERAALDHFLMKTILAEEARNNNRTAGQRARKPNRQPRVRVP